MTLKLILAALLMSIGTTFSTGSASAGTVPEYRPAIDDVAADKGVMDTDRCIARREARRSVISRCTYGHAKAGKTLVLMGDSHALQYGPALIRLAEQRGWRLIALMRQSCVAAQVNYERTCDAWRNNTMKKIVRRIRPDLVVISTGTVGRYRVNRNGRKLTRRQSEPFLKRGMVKTLSRIRRSGARAAVIQDQAIAPSGILDCLRSQPAPECSFRGGGRKARGDFDARAARSVKGVKLIDPFPRLCPGGTCPAVAGDIIVYRDIYHLSATYAETLAPWLSRRLPNPG